MIVTNRQKYLSSISFSIFISKNNSHFYASDGGKGRRGEGGKGVVERLKKRSKYEGDILRNKKQGKGK